MATAKKLPSGKYRCLIYVGTENGKRKYKSFTADTKKEAELKATQYVMTKEENEKKEASISFSAAMELYNSSKEPLLFSCMKEALEIRLLSFLCCISCCIITEHMLYRKHRSHIYTRTESSTISPRLLSPLFPYKLPQCLSLRFHIHLHQQSHCF